MLASVWFLFAATELALNALTARSVLRNNDLPPGARFLLICYSLTILTLFLVPIGASLRLFISSMSRFMPNRTPIAWIADGLIVVLTWFLLLLYGASWGLFWQTGSFIDSQTFFFLAPHPLQVFHWVETDAILALLALTLTAALLVGKLLPRWLEQRHSRMRGQLVVAWSVAVGLCLAGTFLGTLYSSWGERRYMRFGILYNRNQENISGPLPYILTDIRRRVGNQSEELSMAPGFQIIQRPIVPMDQYLRSIGNHKINRWNVLMLTVESLRADQLRAYGGNRDAMPAVDAVAHEGRVFLNAYTQSSHTNYATIVPLSSHYPLRSAMAYNYPEHPTYPRVLIYDVLKALGYHTAIFSSSNEYWGGMINYLQTGNLDRFIHAANFKGPTYVMQDDAGFAAWVRETKHAGSVDDRFTVDEAIKWIDSLEAGPFFISLNLQNSHLPYPIPRDFPRRFGPAKLDFTIRFGLFPKEKAELVKDVYADSLAYVDSQIGRLFQHLKSKGIWENTLIVLTGDHGQAFYEHGFASHGSAIFDEVMRVPLIIRGPALKPGVETRVAQHVDIAPSVLSVLGLPPHPSFQGIDLLSSFSNPKRSAYMVAQTPEAHQYGVVRSGFKLIYDERQREYSLYDLASDPGERSNIAASQPLLVNELAARLNAWRKLQIDYYSDATLQAREYPPILGD